MSDSKFNMSPRIDFDFIAIIILILLCTGEPDIIDSIIAVLQALAKYLGG